MLTSAFVSFVSCLDACLDAVGVRPPLDCSKTGIVRSNLIRGVVVRLVFLCSFCLVYTEALVRVDPPSKESYQVNKSIISKVNSEL
jgi:hypothetical protein